MSTLIWKWTPFQIDSDSDSVYPAKFQYRHMSWKKKKKNNQMVTGTKKNAQALKFNVRPKIHIRFYIVCKKKTGKWH